MSPEAKRAVADYRNQLRRSARTLPRAARKELLAEIDGHINEGSASARTDAEVFALLEDLGAPESIVKAAQTSAPTGGGRTIVMMLLLLIPIVPFVSWIFGASMLVGSRLWTTKEKALGLLVWPGGYLGLAEIVVLIRNAPERCQSIPFSNEGSATVTTCVSDGIQLHGVLGVVAFAVWLGAPLVVCGYLWTVGRRRHALNRLSADASFA